jgi:hypothetical protein
MGLIPYNSQYTWVVAAFGAAYSFHPSFQLGKQTQNPGKTVQGA